MTPGLCVLIGKHCCLFPRLAAALGYDLQTRPLSTNGSSKNWRVKCHKEHPNCPSTQPIAELYTQFILVLLFLLCIIF